MENHQAPRDYSAISPSAKYVLLLKGETDIPYARQTAEWVSGSEPFPPDSEKRDFFYWAKVLHLEARYKSIDQLLSDLEASNILELSSGLSLRGLAIIRDKDITYIDTDLPEMVKKKAELLTALGDKGQLAGQLLVLPLNAMDEAQFASVVDQFPEGKVVIVNEGLLMYLDTDEKRKLCRNIKRALEQRGGYWITADVYVKPTQMLSPAIDDKLGRFGQEMNIRENMFESFAAAEAFFKGEGFVIDKTAEPEYSKSPVVKHLKESATAGQLESMGKYERIDAAWRLRLA